MELARITINNFKSLGEVNNKIIVNNNLISLVGKNEAGKTNILQALSRIDKPIIEYIQTKQMFAFLPNDINRVNKKNPSIDIKFVLTSKDKKAINVLIRQYHLGDLIFGEDLSDELNIKFAHNTVVTHSGIIKDILDNSKKISDYFKFFFQNKAIYMQNQTEPIKNQINEISSMPTFIDKILTLKIELSKVNSQECKEKFPEIINCFSNIYAAFTIIIPKFIFVNLPVVEKKNSLAEFQKELKNEDSFYYKLFKFIDFDPKIIMPIFNKGKDNFRREYSCFKEKVDVIVSEFNNRKVIDEIKLEVDIDNGYIGVYLDDDIEYEERSDGFKQVFNLFLSTGRNDEKEQKYVFLIDEPDKSLHINAQRELLRLFKKIASQKNYIIYNTHSPFMIDSEDITSVRLIVKTDEITEIKKDMCIQSEEHISRMETLTPVYHSIGYQFSDKLGPIYNKLNIVVEGKWDKVYLETMMDYCKINEEKRPCIIASVGAQNVPNIAKILISWGIETRIILDNDTEGRDVYDKLEKAGLADRAVYVKNCDKTEKCKTKCNCDFEIEDITYDHYEKIDNRIKEEYALGFRKSIKENQDNIDEFTIDNYKRLFQNLGIAIK